MLLPIRLINAFSKKITLHKQQINNKIIYSGTCFNNQSYSTDIPNEAIQSWEKAKPLRAMPRSSISEILFGFLPGGKFYKKELDEITMQFFNDKGDIMFLPGLFGKPDMVMTKNPDDFATVFRNDGPWPYRKGFEILTAYRNEHRKDFFGEKSGLLTTHNKEWGEFRSVVNPILIHPKNVKVYLPMMSKVSDEFITRIKKIRDPETLEMPENFKDEISCWTLESVSVVALDKQLGIIRGENADAKKFFDNLQKFFDLAVDLEIKPSLWRKFPNKKLKQVFAILDDMIDFCEKHVNESIKHIEEDNVAKPDDEKSVLEKLLAVDRKLAVIMAMDMLFAGVDTTTTTFTGLLFCLAKNPDKQIKLRQEILEHFPEKDTPLSVQNMKNLPYLRACIKESLRYYPLAQGNIRTTSKDMVLSGFQVPKGTEVGLMFLTLLRDEQHFSDPLHFTPERWLRKTEDACPHITATKSKDPFVYLPFGFGPRSCIGRRIAEMEIEIGIVQILRNFHIEFNHSVEKPFKALSINVPAVPLKFKFVDLSY